MTDLLAAPLWLSLRVASLATLVAFLIAVPLAFINARRRYWGVSVIDTLAILPMVLPPTVLGYFILVTLGRRGVVGQHLYAWFDYTIMFRIESAVLAGILVAVPLIYLPARAALASVSRELEDVARLNGAGTAQVFWHVSLPLARRGLASGTMLAFARALGEFGATAMVFGIREREQTLATSIYLNYERGAVAEAAPAVVVLFLLSAAITLAYNRAGVGRAS